MAITINWVTPSNTSVGSVLVYRADNTKLDSLGSRSIIATIGAKDGVGSWVVAYTDSAGVTDNIYRVQFWDGVGSSPFSDAISQEFSEQLATFDDVLRLARINNMDDIGSAAVFDAIQDATEEIFFLYGDPIRRTTFYLDSETGVKGRAYDFTGDYNPVYQVREVFVDSVDTDIVKNSDYEINFNNGIIRFSDVFLGSYQGKNVYIHWVPAYVNLTVKYKAALQLVEGEFVLSGVDAENVYIDRLKRKVNMFEDELRPKGVFTADTFDTVSGYKPITQQTDRTSLFFSTS